MPAILTLLIIASWIVLTDALEFMQVGISEQVYWVLS